MAAEEILGEDTRRSLASGRQTAGEMLVAVRGKLRRVFILFVIGLLATIWALRVWVWPAWKQDLLARGADVIVITPFDVILLQAKLGIGVGILISIPAFIYYAREPLKRRGLYPEEGVARWKFVAMTALSVLLFGGGVVYSYNIFFPIMFDFLANNAISAGLAPTYSIVDWTQFIVVLGLSFGLAAQLPLVMTVLAYTNIVPYETFRDKWKYAIVIMFGFGALFSPPDPFTQMMWAFPLIALYALSLYLARLAVALRRGRDAMDVVGDLRANRKNLAAGFVLAGGLCYWFLTNGYKLVNRLLLPEIPGAYRPPPIRPLAILPFDGTVGAGLVGVAVGLVVAAVLAAYYSWPEFEPAPQQLGDPTAIDLREVDAAGVQAAPPEVFAEMDEETAVELAREAIDQDNPDKGRAILDRFDEAPAGDESDEAIDEEEEVVEGQVTQATTNVVDAVTEDEMDEDDIGGYYYDLAFIFDSLRSKAFRLFAVFGIVLVSVFTFLYSGGIGTIKRDFLRRLPTSVQPEEVSVITLHPVEALVFEVKIATLLGIVATIPLLLYYAWPAMKNRGLVRGDRNLFFGWAGAIIAGIFFGSAIGYLYIAPAVISWLVWDALQANMVIAYRVSNFFWLIFFTTVGIGLWFDIPVSMLLFHRGGLIPYQSMREHWRGVTLGVMAFTAVFTPSSVLSMILVAIPVMLGYGLGLGILWFYTLGGRRAPRPAGT